MSVKINIIFLISILYISACGTTGNPNYGVIDNNNFPEVFMSGITDKKQEIIFYSRAIWYPNKNGFKFLPAGKKARKGVVVITDKGFYFAEWRTGNNYQTVLDIKFEEIEMVREASLELLKRVVIKRDKYNSFEILGVEGPELPSKDQTDIAYKLLVQQSES